MRFTTSSFVWVAMILLVVGIGSTARVRLLATHFAHTDDIAVAVNLISLVEHRAHYEAQTQHKLAMLLDGSEGSPLQQAIVQRLQGAGFLTHAVRLRTLWAGMHSVPRTTTYAPAQFYLTRLLISPDQGYSMVKFMGRLPSLLFGLLAVAGTILLLLGGGDPACRRERALVGVALTALSWQCVIYSAQMESYSIGVFAVTCLLLLLQRTITRPDPQRRDGVHVGVILGLLAMMQYQILFFLPAFYAAACFALRQRLPWRRLAGLCATSWAGFALVAIPLVFPHLIGRTDAGVNWNSGPVDEFLLTAATGRVWDVLAFFVRNVPLVAIAMLSPVEEGSALVNLLASLVVTLMIVGLVASVRSPRHEQRAFAVFAMSLALVWLALLGAGKLTLGPTRHSMVLIPVFVVLTVEGFVDLIGRLRAAGIAWSVGSVHAGAIGFAAVWMVLFLVSAPYEMGRRADHLSEREFSARLSATGAEAVAYYGWSEAPYLMPTVRRAYPLLDGNQLTPPRGPIVALRNGGRDDRDLVGRPSVAIAFYSRQEPFSMDTHRALIEAIGRRYGMQAPVLADVVHATRIDSRTEVDWSSRTNNGTNGHHFTVVRISRRGEANR